MAINAIPGGALGVHPNWGGGRPITRPPAPPRPRGIASAGSALIAPPKPSGIGTAGTAILPAQKSPTAGLSHPSHPPSKPTKPTTPATPTPTTPAAPDLSGNKWMGYLTPDQLANLTTAGNTYTSGVGNWIAASGLQLDANGHPIVDASGNPVLNQAGTGEIAYNQAVSEAQHAHDVSQQRAIEEMAARGLSVSGIRDSDLTDINRTLVDTTAVATANLDTLIGEATRAIAGLNAGWNTAQLLGQGQAATNATPTVAAAPTPAASTPAAPAPGRTPIKPGIAQAGSALS